MTCKSSYNRIYLSDNIVFIGVWNSYNLSKIDDFNGLTTKNDKKLYTNSIYTVNSLPHRLLNYILNFGSPSAENEKNI